MATAIFTGSTGPTSTATGHSGQRHLIWAVNQGAWWVFFPTASNALSARYSTNGTTWSAPTGSPFGLAHTELAIALNFAVAYANISTNDVLHLVAEFLQSDTTSSRFTLGTTWANTNAEVTSYAAAYGYAQAAGNGSCILSEDNHRFDLTDNANAYPYSLVHPNADSGTSWTYSAPTASQRDSATPNYCGSSGFASLGTSSVLACFDNGSDTSNKHTNLRWSAYTGTWSTAANIFASNFTATNNAHWGIVGVTTSDIHCVALTNNSNAFGHRRFNGMSWADGNTLPTLTLAALSGISLVTDGTNVWAWAIDSSGNICYCKWNGSAWDGSWTTQEATRSNTPGYITACINSAKTAVQVAWTETNGSNYEVWTSQLVLTTPDVTINVSALAMSEGLGTATPNWGQAFSVSGLSIAESLGVPTIGYGRSTTVTGLSMTETLGTPAATGGANVTATGLQMIETLPAPVIQFGRTTTVTGLQMIEALGTPTIGYGQSITATGLQMTEALGTPTIGYGQSVTATGLQMIEALGTATATGAAAGTVNASALVMAESLGTPTIGYGLTFSVSALHVTESLGTHVASGGASTAVSGLQMMESLGTVTVPTSADVTISVTALAEMISLGIPSIIAIAPVSTISFPDPFMATALVVGPNPFLAAARPLGPDPFLAQAQYATGVTIPVTTTGTSVVTAGYGDDYVVTQGY